MPSCRRWAGRGVGLFLFCLFVQVLSRSLAVHLISRSWQDSENDPKFIEFFEDMLPELQTIGPVLQFKVWRAGWCEMEMLLCASGLEATKSVCSPMPGLRTTT